MHVLVECMNVVHEWCSSGLNAVRRRAEKSHAVSHTYLASGTAPSHLDSNKQLPYEYEYEYDGAQTSQTAHSDTALQVAAT